MKRFWDALIEPIFRKLEPRLIIEIGSLRGKNTRYVLRYCQDHDATLHVIDPLPQFDVTVWQARYGDHYVFHAAKSLDVLLTIEPADAVLIDGDHNWYTVYHELKQLAQVAAEHQRPFPVVLFHDVAWPYARRDLYYNPDDIPPEFRQPYGISGLSPGQSALDEDGLNEGVANAVSEGGPRNGVLTAIEDFMQESDEPLNLLRIDGFHGLGILYPMSLADRAPALTSHFDRLMIGLDVLGGHLRAMEEERLNSRVKRHQQKARAGDRAARGEHR